jgi:peptide/nickel transport system substrate-binding protein
MFVRRSAPRRSLSMTRRGLMGSALAAGAALSLPLPRGVFAQDAATPVVEGEIIRSQTREEFTTELIEDRGFTEATTPGGTYISSSVGDIQTIHPFLAEDGPSLGVIGLLYEGLVGGDLRTGRPAPNGLADYWEVAPDGRTYTFYLNKDAKWHDGVDITAEDVKFSFDALANPEVASAYSQTFLDATESWRDVDEHTFELVAKEPLWTFLNDLYSVVIPKHIWEEVPVAEWRTDGGATGQDPTRVVGSGPFKFQEWRQGESITLVRNDDYFQKVPYLDSIVIRIWPDQTAVVNALLAGEIDAATVPPADVESVEATEGLLITTYPTRGFAFYMTNLDPEKSQFFLDKRVRQALLYALDRQSIVDDILLGYGEVAQGTQPVISYAYAPGRISPRYDFDPEKAKSLLAEAGWIDTDSDGILEKDGNTFSFELIYPSGSPTTDQLLAYMQDAWRQIGIEMTPRALEFPSLVETITGDHNFDMAMLFFNWDATFIQDAMFGCNQYEGGFNMVRYCNEKVDELNAQAKRTFDEGARTELIIEATNIVNEELPVAVLYFGQGIAGYSDRLQNYKPSAWGSADASYLWIQQ